MLGKLMKYEFKATGRVFLPMFGVLLILALFNKLFMVLHLTTPIIILSSLSGSFMVATMVVVLVFTLQRFRRNLLRDEGYLMLTLPVGTDSLIWSKLLVASIWTVVSAAVMALAGLIMAATGDTIGALARTVREIFRSMSGSDIRVFVIALETLATAVAVLFGFILLLYACMALSLLVNKHRSGFSFLAFCVFGIIGEIIIGIVAKTQLMQSFSRAVETMQPFGQIQSVLGAALLCALIPAAVFYLITRYMLKNRLNLE